ncbi:hypothetical protein C8F01DRAFT_1098774 [Mycena amicta]|nr:hypothetical protein C8F01DRAFT_1098774 [Mycena amicta]
MARSSASAEAKTNPSPSQSDLKSNHAPMKLTGIIILPPSYPRPGDDSSTSSNSEEATLAHSSSVPNLRERDREREEEGDSSDHAYAAQLNRRLSTSTSSLSVRFAPLPQLAPRKRRSTTPLGIASRAIMMRRRRAGTPGFDMNGDPLPPTPPMWTDEEVERHTERILAERSEHASSRDHSDDPLLILGKKMKSAWRKMNNKKPPPTDPDPAPVVVAERVVLAPLPADNSQPHEEGGVWEEEVSDRFPLNVSQTDTVVEGRYPWLAQLAGLSDSPTDSSQRPGTLYMASEEPGREASTSSSSTSLSDSDSATTPAPAPS